MNGQAWIELRRCKRGIQIIPGRGRREAAANRGESRAPNPAIVAHIHKLLVCSRCSECDRVVVGVKIASVAALINAAPRISSIGRSKKCPIRSCRAACEDRGSRRIAGIGAQHKVIPALWSAKIRRDRCRPRVPAIGATIDAEQLVRTGIGIGNSGVEQVAGRSGIARADVSSMRPRFPCEGSLLAVTCVHVCCEHGRFALAET